MKLAWIALLVFPMLSQMADSPQYRDDPDNDVAAFLKMWKTGVMASSIPNHLNREGDAAAVALTRIIAGRALGPTDVRGCLIVLGSAFARPLIVNNKLDREPRTALFVLRYLDSATSDKEIKNEIAEMKSLIERSALESSKSPELPPNVTGNPDRSSASEPCCVFISEALHAVQQIRPGMTRAKVEETFRQDGGLSGYTETRYLYHSCENIVVKIQFKLRRDNALSRDDTVISVGQPYLAYPSGD